MELLSIQVGRPAPVEWEGKTLMTGIFKSSIPGPVWVRKFNIEGDGQGDLDVHGGEDKAVYAYSADIYDWWKRELGVAELPYGAFGENLTIAGLDENRLCVGDVLALGDCRLQVVEPRFPCFTLGVKFRDMEIIKTFLRSGRPGIYFRVLQEGMISAGDKAAVAQADPERVPLNALFEMKIRGALAPEVLRRLLRIPHLNETWRKKARTLLEGEV